MNVTQTPSISLIVAVYNAASTISRCLESVAAQTYTSHELIVIDGGSTDETVDIIRRNTDRLSYWISEPDRGVYSAWNKGLAHARGNWIGFLGADDFLWTPDALERLVREGARVFPERRIVYGRVGFVSARGEMIETFGQPWHEIRDEFRRRMALPHPSVLCHRSLFVEHGLFDESFCISGDYEWLLRELKDHDAQFVDGPCVVGMQAGGMSSQAARGVQIYKETARAHEKHGIKPKKIFKAWAYTKAYIRTKGSILLGEDLAALLMNKLRCVRGWLQGSARRRYPRL